MNLRTRQVDNIFFIRGGWDVLINQTGLTFMVFTEKYDLAVKLYTVPRNAVHLCSAVYVNYCTVHNNTALYSFVAFHNEQPIL